MRRRAPRTVDVAQVAVILRDPPGGATMRCAMFPLDLERAHACLDEPYVTVRALQAETFLPSEPMRECAWSIEVVAFDQDEACDLADAALERLRADVAAGRIERGTHNDYPRRDPFGRREQELAWFWHEQLAQWERS